MEKIGFSGFKPRYSSDWAVGVVEKAIEKRPRGWAFCKEVFAFTNPDLRRVLASGSKVWRVLRDFAREYDSPIFSNPDSVDHSLHVHDARQLFLWELRAGKMKINPWERIFLEERLVKLDEER